MQWSRKNLNNYLHARLRRTNSRLRELEEQRKAWSAMEFAENAFADFYKHNFDFLSGERERLVNRLNLSKEQAES